MKKISIFLGTIGGAVAGYLFSNSKLREELSGAKDAEAAGKILAKHLQQDGKKIGSEVQKFAKSPEVQNNLKKAKRFVEGYAKKLNADLKGLVRQGKADMKSVKKTAKEAPVAAKKAAIRASKVAKKFVQKAV